jgi:hypothetical protein
MPFPPFVRFVLSFFLSFSSEFRQVQGVLKGSRADCGDILSFPD